MIMRHMPQMVVRASKLGKVPTRNDPERSTNNEGALLWNLQARKKNGDQIPFSFLKGRCNSMKKNSIAFLAS